MTDGPEERTDTGRTGASPGAGTGGPAGTGGDRTTGGAPGGGGEAHRDAGGTGPDSEEARRRLSDGVRQGLGVLSAFKDALEETIRDSRDRGELSSERAKEVIQGAMARAREAAGEARERLDFATRQEIDDLREAVDELKVRLEHLERRAPQDPDVGPTRSSGPEGAA